jgi:V/A-type H+-transporting ATPase subunit E
MALQDILAAISVEADRQIAEARTAHQNALTQIRQQSEQSLDRKRQDISAQKEQKLEQMRRKAEVHADTQLRNAQLQKKREILDRIYQKAIESLSQLPDKDVEALLKACLESIHDKGEIRPTKKHVALMQRLVGGDLTLGDPVEGAGGFIFVSEKREQDFRFETLVQDVLRPKTELELAHSLFTAA